MAPDAPFITRPMVGYGAARLTHPTALLYIARVYFRTFASSTSMPKPTPAGTSA